MAEGKKNEIVFVRVNILENFRFWHKFAREHTMLEVGQEVLAQADALMYEDDSNARASLLIKEAHAFSEKRRVAGSLGGQKRALNAGQKLKSHFKTPSKEELYDFVEEQNIDDHIARQFWEICESRNWCDKNGKKIGNWKGALINFSKTMEANNDSDR